MEGCGRRTRWVKQVGREPQHGRDCPPSPSHGHPGTSYHLHREAAVPWGVGLALGGAVALCPYFGPTLAEASTPREATVHLQVGQ